MFEWIISKNCTYCYAPFCMSFPVYCLLKFFIFTQMIVYCFYDVMFTESALTCSCQALYGQLKPDKKQIVRGKHIEEKVHSVGFLETRLEAK